MDLLSLSQGLAEDNPDYINTGLVSIADTVGVVKLPEIPDLTKLTNVRTYAKALENGYFPIYLKYLKLVTHALVEVLNKPEELIALITPVFWPAMGNYFKWLFPISSAADGWHVIISSYDDYYDLTERAYRCNLHLCYLNYDRLETVCGHFDAGAPSPKYLLQNMNKGLLFIEKYLRTLKKITVTSTEQRQFVNFYC